jgi:hypothetical protein
VSSADPITAELMAIIGVLHGGERALARERFGELWARIEGRDAFHECVLCHYMADAQDDPADELAWDLRALNAADGLADWPPARCGPAGPVRGLYPSLHLNLAADYVKLQRPEAARVHLARARAATRVLADDGYGNGVRAAIARLEQRMAAEEGPAGQGPHPGRFA